MKKIILTMTALVLFAYTIYGQISAQGDTFINTAQQVEFGTGFVIEGPSLLYACAADYSIHNLPSDITNAHWTITDNRKLKITEDNGVNGCHVERVPFKSHDREAFCSTEVYPYGKAELVFKFEWGGYFYSVSKTIKFGVAPNPVSDELLFTSLVNPAQCRSGRGNVMFHDIRTGALVFQYSNDFCSTFSISTYPIPNGLYLVRLVMNGQLIQQENIWILHR